MKISGILEVTSVRAACISKGRSSARVLTSTESIAVLEEKLIKRGARRER